MRNLEKLIIVLLFIVAITIPACSQKDLKQSTELTQPGQPAPVQAKAVPTVTGVR